MTTEILKDYIIYKIYCKNNEITEEYYGHTSAFRARKWHHKGQCNNETYERYNTEKYKIIRLNGGWDNWEMVPIEELKNCSLVNAKIREQFYIDLNKSGMNKNKAYITEEQIIERDKKYHLENIDKISEKNKEWYLENRDKILEKKKEYHLENRDKISEKKKEYRLENRDKISEKKKEKMTCVCGSTFRICAKARHEKSKKHQQFLQQ